MRAEDYKSLFYKLLHRIGHTADEYDGDDTVIGLHHKYRGENLLREYNGVMELFVGMWEELLDKTIARGEKTIDPNPFFQRAYERFGKVGFDMAVEKVEALNRGLMLSPHGAMRSIEWKSVLELHKLFDGHADSPEGGRFIDQRFVDYLSLNSDRLPEMHWRLFESLAAEFFGREGYEVKLGPGSNDDGVDVRVWKPGSAPTDTPLCIVQCKRQKAKVERVVVKGLYADVQHEGAEYGVIVTTSELSPGARNNIATRGYPIHEVEREGLRQWLLLLRTPGTGIVRL